jgi:RNA polymerase sigma factor (TIGR02999 family)
MTDITRILSAIEQGDSNAADLLLPLVYDELRKLAAHKMDKERPGQTLQATALVHEAYLRLTGGDQARHWEGRRHFFAAAAEAMRRILVDSARRKQSPKHGGGLRRIDLDEALLVEDGPPVIDLIALDEALAKLAAEEPVKAELVKLRIFAGLTIPEAAKLLRISTATAERYWTYARTWLYCALDDGGATRET